MAEAGNESVGSLPSLHGTRAEEQNLIVAMRIRPMSEDEIIMGATPIAHKVDEKMVVLMDPMEDPDDILRANRSREKQYMFDCTFDGSCCQKEVYEKTSKLLIPSVINGYNATVFAYGATGTGKTYTMLGTDEDPGIMAHVLNELFLEMERGKQESAYSVSLSYLEIYNEMIRDLLNPASGYLDLREDAKGVQVAGLSEFMAETTEEVMDILTRGNKERSQEPTKANKESSRSHAILQITVQQKDRLKDFTQQVKTGKFFMIDLAGSERAANTQNRGKRLVEGAHINRSLLALGNCIKALGTDKNKLKYINYRDSKLTRLLKDSLGGNCKTVMIAHISPAHLYFEESRNTLVYADRAKNIKTKVRRNVSDITYHLSQYQNIIQDLKEEIKRLHRKLENNAHLRSNLESKQSEETNREKQTALDALKQKLNEGFTEQMDLRRNLMNLNNTMMEISLETFQNQGVIHKWEREKEIIQRKQAEVEEAKYREDLKTEGEETALSLMESPVEPDEVAVARSDMVTLQSDRESTERLRINVQRELSNARSRADKVEQSIPNLTNDSNHREILQLLCKIHELEIDNLEMQSSCLLRNFEISKRDMALSIYHHHRQLAHEIIHQQRVVLDEQHVPCPLQLDELYDAYQLECGKLKIERNLSLPEIQLPHNNKASLNGSLLMVNQHRLLTGSVSDTDHLSVVDEVLPSTSNQLILPKLHAPVTLTGGGTGANSVARKQVLKTASMNLAKYEVPDDKIFSPSPKSKAIREAQARLRALSPQSMTKLTSSDPVLDHHQSIVTLSTPPSVKSLQGQSNDKPNYRANKPDNKDVIANRTRGIARVAASKRISKAHINASNTAEKHAMKYRRGNQIPVSPGSDKLDDDASSYLTQSRLAQHNQAYGSNLTPDLISHAEVVTDPSPPRHPRPIYRPTHGLTSEPNINTGHSNRQQDQALYQQLSKAAVRRTNESLANEGASRAGDVPPSKRSQRSHLPLAAKPSRHKALAALPPTRTQVRVTRAEVDLSPDLKPVTDRKFNSVPSEPVIGQKKKKHGQYASKQPNQLISNPSAAPYPNASTSQDKEDGKLRHQTIPAYKKGDISVTGLGLQ